MRLVLLGGIVGYTASMLLIATLGPTYGCGIIGLTFGAAYLGHTERSKWLVGLFLAAIDKHMSRKAAAITMGVQPSQISRWESGEEQMPLNKLALLPNEVLLDATEPIHTGCGNVVAPSGRLASAASALLRYLAVEEAKAQVTLPQQRSA